MSRVLKDVSIAATANASGLLISVAVALMLPKLLSIENYGYLQLYLLYTSYLGLLHLGWIDGVYLRYGGVLYEDLDHRLLGGEFRVFTSVAVVFGGAMFVCGLIALPSESRSTVIALTGLCVMLQLPGWFLAYVLQATGRVRDYSHNVLLERGLFLVFGVAVVSMGARSFVPLVVCDLLAKGVALIRGARLCSEIVSGHGASLRDIASDALENVRVGIGLMFANIAGLLVIGVLRFAISSHWDVETFARVSVALSVTNLLMVFISALSMVLFPLLRRLSAHRLAGSYSTIRDPLMAILFTVLLMFYPFAWFMSMWLPDYAESIRYAGLLLPLSVYQSKMMLMVGTYLKTIREESWLLRLNVGGVLASGISVGILVFWLHSLELAIVAVVVIVALRSDAGELVVSRLLRLDLRPTIVLEAVLATIFVLSAWLIGGLVGFAVYAIALSVYVVARRGPIMRGVGRLRVIAADG